MTTDQNFKAAVSCSSTKIISTEQWSHVKVTMRVCRFTCQPQWHFIANRVASETFIYVSTPLYFSRTHFNVHLWRRKPSFRGENIERNSIRSYYCFYMRFRKVNRRSSDPLVNCMFISFNEWYSGSTSIPSANSLIIHQPLTCQCPGVIEISAREKSVSSS